MGLNRSANRSQNPTSDHKKTTSLKRTVSVLVVTVLSMLSMATQALEGGLGLKVYGVKFEEFELRHSDDKERILAWDSDAFYGDDELRFHLFSEGEYDTRADVVEGTETQVIVQKPVSEFFDVTAGMRYDTSYDFADRWYGAVGYTGLAPQWFEVDLNLFVSEIGDVSARFEADYELLFVNRLYLVTSIESTYAFIADEEAGVGNGLNNIELGMRLHYDVIHHKLAPYIGVFYENYYGDTADFRDGDKTTSFAVGVQLLF